MADASEEKQGPVATNNAHACAEFAPRPPVFDANRYLPMAEDFECTEEEKLEFLQTLWGIMCEFVDLGWGADSISILLAEIFENASTEPLDEVESKGTQSTKLNEKKTTAEAVSEVSHDR